MSNNEAGQERRNNHILSEKQGRDMIRGYYNELDPFLHPRETNKGLSKFLTNLVKTVIVAGATIPGPLFWPPAEAEARGRRLLCNENFRLPCQ